jgi:hypothetical protein
LGTDDSGSERRLRNIFLFQVVSRNAYVDQYELDCSEAGWCALC